MKRHFVLRTLILGVLTLVASTTFAVGVAPSKLIGASEAEAVGLKRAWFAQVEMDQRFDEVTSATIQDGILFTTTSAGVLQLFDAETGTTLWTTIVGDKDGYLLPPAVNSKVVVALSGAHIYVYDRANGKLLSKTELPSLPSSAPVMTEGEVYVPTFGEKIFSYAITPTKTESRVVDSTVNDMLSAVKNNESAAQPLQDRLGAFQAQNSAELRIESLDEKRPLSTATFGVSNAAPVAGTQGYDKDMIAWTTSEGWLMVAAMTRNTDASPFKLYYKLQARPYFSYVNEQRVGNRALIPRVDVAAEPFFCPEDKSMQNMAISAKRREGGMLLVGSRSGHVFAMNDATGDLRWTYLTETPISDRISAFGDAAYVPTESGDLFATALKDGREIWKASGVKRLVSASDSRLYVVDSLNRLAVLNRATGARVKVLDIGNTQYQLFNQETDRVYLVYPDGLIQCLRETQLEAPIRHRATCAEIAAKLAALAKNRGADVSVDADANADANADSAEPAQVAPAKDAVEEEKEDDPFGSNSDEESDSQDEGVDDEGEGDEEDPFAEEEEEDPFA